MKISPNDTIRKVIIKNGTLFGIGNKRIYESCLLYTSDAADEL